MRRILLTVAYDGTDFHGFAYQDGVRTVEGVLADAITELCGHDAEITGASRTDAGVHAYGNLASFDTTASIPAERFAAALNTVLDEDVRVVLSEEMPADYHPRKTGWRKSYEYRILNADMPDPVQRRYTYHYRSALDTVAMDKAAKALIGEHDFTSFCSVHSQTETRVRTIFDCGVTVRERIVTVHVTGSGFLYHMVRIIAGTLLDVGRGRISPDEMPRILEGRDRLLAGATLPPQGLFLMGYHRTYIA